MTTVKILNWVCRSQSKLPHDGLSGCILRWKETSEPFVSSLSLVPLVPYTISPIGTEHHNTILTWIHVVFIKPFVIPRAIESLVDSCQVVLISVNLNMASINVTTEVEESETSTLPQQGAKKASRVVSLEEKRDIRDLLLQGKTNSVARPVVWVTPQFVP